MYKKEITDKRTYKALFLLNLLSFKECTKNDIVNEFKKNNFKISKTSIANYIKKLKAYSIPIKTRQCNGQDKYFLDKKDLSLNIEDYEAMVAQDVKKLLVLEGDYENIRQAMKLFYKFALLTPDREKRTQLADFGYFSKINWELVSELERHCEDKNVIQIVYVTPEGIKRLLTVHADAVIVGGWTQRLYFRGVFEYTNQFSNLPIDRIYMVKKVINDFVRFDMEAEVLTYKVDKEVVPLIEFDNCEKVTSYEGNLAVVKKPIDDSFKLIQKLMFCCPDLYYISDARIKSRVEEKLYILKDTYNDRPY